MINKRITSIVNKYERVGKPSLYPKCELCGGRIIKDREWVCSNCGLVQKPILEPSGKRDPGFANKETIESNKDAREDNWDKKIHKLLHYRTYIKDYMKDYRKNKKAIWIDKEVKTRIKKYCKKENFTIYSFVSAIIVEVLNQLEKTEEKK